MSKGRKRTAAAEPARPSSTMRRKVKRVERKSPITTGSKRRPAEHAHARDGGLRLAQFKRLDAYLRDRADIEGVGYDLTPNFFMSAFRGGARTMFGVEMCDHGELLGDAQEPYPGYFKAWMEAYAIVTDAPLLHEDALSVPRTQEAHGRSVRVATDQLLATIRSSVHQLIRASWCCDSRAPTITGFLEDLRSGYSTHDMPADDLRSASLAAGELTAICALNDWSVRDALAMVSVRDELSFDGQVKEGTSSPSRR